ncbi:MAG: DUF3352 domain-containing protein, partial [Bacteroidota bacterium]
MKKLLRLLLFVLLLGLAAIAGYLFLGESVNRQLYTFVPTDFVYVIESDEPVDDWQELSKSQVWQYLKTNAYFGEITESADQLDSLLHTNQTLVNFIKLGDLVISAHLTGRNEYEFVFLVDLKGISKFSKLSAALTALFESLEYDVSRDSYYGNAIFDLKDPETGDVLSLSVIDNVMLGSYKKGLLKKAIDQSEKPGVYENPDFFQVQESIDRDEVYSIYLNYAVLEDYLKIYTDELPEMLQGLREILAFSSFDFQIGDEDAALTGYTKQVDSTASYLTVFKDIGQGRVLAPEVLPKETAFFTSIGFDDFSDFYRRFDGYYKEYEPESHQEFAKNKRRVEKLLDIDVERDFFSWMTDELVTAIVPMDKAGKEYAYFALLHFDDYRYAKEKMDFVTQQVKKKTPVKFETVTHRGVPIQYLELKGFFKLFFNKMFSNIERPHYAFVNDYVVFSNSVPSLEMAIDRALDQETLEYSPAYDDFQGHFSNNSNLFSYVQAGTFYQHLLNNLDASSRSELKSNRKYFLSFPHIGFQLYP